MRRAQFAPCRIGSESRKRRPSGNTSSLFGFGKVLSWTTVCSKYEGRRGGGCGGGVERSVWVLSGMPD